ncbi:MAG: SDR family NAD(P)-dependent oxidoreductase [Terrimicrobiaceae bacterium]
MITWMSPTKNPSPPGSKRPFSNSAAYSATKYGIQGFSEALFKDLRAHNIEVTCVNPGSIDTLFFKDSGIEPHRNTLQPEDIAALVMHILETPDNLLVDEISLRTLIPNPPGPSNPTDRQRD